MEYEDFSNRFKQACREASAPTAQEALGKFLGVSGTMVWFYRNGERAPGIRQASIIAAKLGVNVEWLLTGNGPKRTHTQELMVADEPGLYNDKLYITLDLLTFVMRFIEENYANTYKKESPEDQAETIYALCDLFTDEAAKKMKPASVIKLIRKTA